MIEATNMERVTISQRITVVSNVYQSAIVWIEGHRFELSNYEATRLAFALAGIAQDNEEVPNWQA